MSLRIIIDTLRAAVEALTPTTTPALPFRGAAIEGPMGIDAQAMLLPRAVEVVPLGVAVEGPLTSLPAPSYLRHEVAVRVAYARSAWRSEVDRADAIASDAAQIIGTLRNPATWAAVASYCSPEQPERADVLDENGTAIGIIMQVRCTVEFAT